MNQRRKRRSRRQEREEEELAAAAFLYLTLSDEEWDELNESKLNAGSKKGKKNIIRQRKEVESMFAELGNKARRSHRMSIESFLGEGDMAREFGCRSPGCLAPQLAPEIDLRFREPSGERGNPEAFKTRKRGNPELVFQPGPISGGLPGPVWNGSQAGS